MNAQESLSKKLGTLKERAIKLTTEIAAVHDRGIVQNLHAASLDLLLSIVEIERDTKHLISTQARKKALLASQTAQPTQNSRTPTTKINSNNLSLQEKVNEEIKKVNRKLPRWAKNPDQINSQILIKFLILQNNNQSERISESELKEAYGNDYEFFRNFNQMRTISHKNHAKVFEVKHGLIEVWDPAKSAVEIFRGEVKGLLSLA